MLLTVRPLSADLLKDTDTIGKADPYIVLVFGKQKRRGTQCKDAGTKPVWNQPYDFTFREDNIQIQVWDKDSLGPDDPMGSTIYNLSQVYSKPNIAVRQTLKLDHKGEPMGTIVVQFVYKPPANNNPQNWGGNQQPWPQNNQQNWGGNQQPWPQNPQNQQGWNVQQGQNKPGPNNQGGFLM